MADISPLVSVCLPVYNGEAYLSTAIDSVLRQTYSSFELVISDNASTDRTNEICREAAVRDPRVKYVRSDTNRGIAGNYRQSFELSRGQYLMWFASDDTIEPEFIRRCVQALESDAQSVISFSHQNYIDEAGRLIRQRAHENDGESDRASERFRRLIRMTHPCAPIFGLMRRATVATTRLLGGFADADRVLLAELALRGRFSLVPEYLYSMRVHPLQTTERYADLRERSLIFDPARAGTTFFPYLLKAGGFCAAVNRSPISIAERVRCYGHLRRWARVQWFELRFDLREGLVIDLKRRLPDRVFRQLRSAKRDLFRRGRAIRECFRRDRGQTA